MVANVQEVLSLDRLGIEVSVREPWLDMGGPVRTLLVAILSWVAEEERRQIASRSKLGVEQARREGKRIGRPAVEVDVARALPLPKRGPLHPGRGGQARGEEDDGPPGSSAGG